MKNKRNEIYELKENIYSANIEKSKLKEKLFTLTEMSKKVDEGYESYNEVSKRVDNIKSLKDVMSFKNLVLKNKIPAKRANVSKNVTYKSVGDLPTPEFIASTELKDSFNKLHYNDKMTLEEGKTYTQTDLKEILNKNVSNSAVTLYASLTDTAKYELQTKFCETMIVGYPSIEKFREKNQLDTNLMVIELSKNSHYMPAMTAEGDFCALIGGDMDVIGKEKINTGKDNIDIWYVRRKG